MPSFTEHDNIYLVHVNILNHKMLNFLAKTVMSAVISNCVNSSIHNEIKCFLENIFTTPCTEPAVTICC